MVTFNDQKGEKPYKERSMFLYPKAKVLCRSTKRPLVTDHTCKDILCLSVLLPIVTAIAHRTAAVGEKENKRRITAKDHKDRVD